MANKLKELRKQNDTTQSCLPEAMGRTVDNLMTEMDAARMGAVDREVVRRDMMTMVQERVSMGVPTHDELDDELRDMCKQVAAETGYRSRLETQHYWVCCIASFFMANDIIVGLIIGGQKHESISMLSGLMLLNLVWYWIVWKNAQGSCLIVKRRAPVGMLWTVVLFFLASFVYSFFSLIAVPTSFDTILFYACIAVDIVIFIISKRTYDNHLNAQCEQYSLQ